ncbi:hypothetical protein AXF42_Ash000286 [Apostasia shenzhenica]|uniref:Smr domain-containing protein n=1 Tax=Apostasia shenzhenica TaxID=1088818 RepID=A0A2I0AFX7_9ASPA|nr:hypothetical protein AXF42_Ash000286 [Apostasia shenzhenica]
MKPSKEKKKKGRGQVNPSSSPLPPVLPKSPKLEFGEDRETRDPEDEEQRALDWLIAAFPLISLEQINSARRVAGGDAYKAAGILSAELLDPGRSPGSAVVKRGARKAKRLTASTGMVSDVIGKDYLKPFLGCGSGKRDGGGQVELEGRAVLPYSSEEAEQFLCSMLGDGTEIGMGIVKDVLSQCGYNLEKALDALLDISSSSNRFMDRVGVNHMEVLSVDRGKGDVRISGIYPERPNNGPSGFSPSSFLLTTKESLSTNHPFKKEQVFQHYVGTGCRDYCNVSVETKDFFPSRSRTVPDLQQKILESLFKLPKTPEYEVNNMNWKKVVNQVKSFGQGLELSFASSVQPSSECLRGKEDYHAFRSVAKKNWDTMRSYYQKAALAYSSGQRAHASYFSEKGTYYRTLAREADEKASQEIFHARNKGIKNVITIDLHGQHVNEAIRLLKLHLVLLAFIPSAYFLRVITGSGADGVGKGKLKSTALLLLQKEGIKYSEENTGTLFLWLDGQRSFSFMESDDSKFDAT